MKIVKWMRQVRSIPEVPKSDLSDQENFKQGNKHLDFTAKFGERKSEDYEV